MTGIPTSHTVQFQNCAKDLVDSGNGTYFSSSNPELRKFLLCSRHRPKLETEAAVYFISMPLYLLIYLHPTASLLTSLE